MPANFLSNYESELRDPTRRSIFDIRRILGRINPDQWNDLRVPLSTTKVGSSNPPTEVIWRTNGAGSTGISGLRFSATQLNQDRKSTRLNSSH